jgi:hypothetical protein
MKQQSCMSKSSSRPVCLWTKFSSKLGSSSNPVYKMACVPLHVLLPSTHFIKMSCVPLHVKSTYFLNSICFSHVFLIKFLPNLSLQLKKACTSNMVTCHFYILGWRKLEEISVHYLSMHLQINSNS